MIEQTTTWKCDSEGCDETFEGGSEALHPRIEPQIPSTPPKWAVLEYSRVTMVRCPKCSGRPASPEAERLFREKVMEGIVEKHGSAAALKPKVEKKP